MSLMHLLRLSFLAQAISHRTSPCLDPADDPATTGNPNTSNTFFRYFRGGYYCQPLRLDRMRWPIMHYNWLVGSIVCIVVCFDLFDVFFCRSSHLNPIGLGILWMACIFSA